MKHVRKKWGILAAILPVLTATLLSNGYAASPSQLSAPQPGSCAAKVDHLHRQLAQARQHQNSAQVRELEKALNMVNTHCNDEERRAKRQEDLAEKQAKVSERQQELRESLQAGDKAEKIQQRKDKLAEAQQGLSEAERAIHAADAH